MIYCNLKQKDKNSAVYFFGTEIEDITGEVEFYTDFSQPKILKQPLKNEVKANIFNKILIKYKKDFVKGIFNQKISYET
ncbi:MAG: hypothetical protein IJN88_09800 [Clostridia bacterium]|nr:hypothetical protein [Clostridia bacterium]